MKAVKIKSTVSKDTREKHKTNGHGYEEPDMDEVDDDDDEVVSVGPKGIFNRRRKNISVKSGIEQLMDDQLSLKSFESKGNSTNASSKVSATRSKGWNEREPRRSYRVELGDPKPTRKYDAGSDFFSRKSFRELGCCDEMIETLRAQDFVRPSHIQVHQFHCLSKSSRVFKLPCSPVHAYVHLMYICPDICLSFLVLAVSNLL